MKRSGSRWADYRRRRSATTRAMASAHSSREATSASRIRSRPGLVPRASRARKLPGTTATFSSASSRCAKCCVVARGWRPQVERGVGHRAGQRRRKQRLQRGELGGVLGTVGDDVRLVVPGGDAGGRDCGRHRRAVIGPIEQERLHQRRVAGDVARPQAGRVGALGQAAEHGEARVTGAAFRLRRGQRPERRDAPRRNRSPSSIRRTRSRSRSGPTARTARATRPGRRRVRSGLSGEQT